MNTARPIPALLLLTLLGLTLFSVETGHAQTATPTGDPYAHFDGKTYSTCATPTPVPTPTPPPTYTPWPTYTPAATYTPPPPGAGEIPPWQMTVSASSAYPGFPAAYVLDETAWTHWVSGQFDTPPHSLTLTLGGSYAVTGVRYLPKQDDSVGRIRAFTVETSSDGISFTFAASGLWADTPDWQTSAFGPVTASHLRLTVHSAVLGDPYASAAELRVLVAGVPVPTDTPAPTATQPPTHTPPPTATSVPTATPFYRVGVHYLDQPIWLSGAGEVFELTISDIVTQPGPQPDAQIVHFQVTVTNHGSRPVILPLSAFFFIRDVTVGSDVQRGQWTADDDALTEAGYPPVATLEESVFSPGSTRSYRLAVAAPTGSVSELGLRTGWQREHADPGGLLGALPVWIRLLPDPVPCLYGAADAIPAAPTPNVYGEALPAHGGGGPTPTPPPGLSAIWPTSGVITRGFGCHAFFTGIDGTAYGCPPATPWFHNGVDIAPPAGTAIVAPVSGSVQFAGADSAPDCSHIPGSQPPHAGYGNYQRLAGWQQDTHYLAHQQAFVVSGGDVNQGDLVGAVGSTGCSSGPHLHWTVVYAGAYLDPATIAP